MTDLVSNLISCKAMAKTISDLVVDCGKVSLVLVALLSFVQTEAIFTVWASRRISSDTYKLNLGAHSNCALDSKGSTRTYLVSEKQCVSDEELQNSM